MGLGVENVEKHSVKLYFNIWKTSKKPDKDWSL